MRVGQERLVNNSPVALVPMCNRVQVLFFDSREWHSHTCSLCSLTVYICTCCYILSCSLLKRKLRGMCTESKCTCVCTCFPGCSKSTHLVFMYSLCGMVRGFVMLFLSSHLYVSCCIFRLLRQRVGKEQVSVSVCSIEL